MSYLATPTPNLLRGGTRMSLDSVKTNDETPPAATKKRGRPPKVELPHEIRIKLVMKAMQKAKNNM